MVWKVLCQPVLNDAGPAACIETHMLHNASVVALMRDGSCSSDVHQGVAATMSIRKW